MIYRKWSLLTGPAAIAGGAVAVAAVVGFFIGQNDQVMKGEQKKVDLTITK